MYRYNRDMDFLWSGSLIYFDCLYFVLYTTICDWGSQKKKKRHLIVIYYFDYDMFSSSGSQNLFFYFESHLSLFWSFMCWVTQIWKKTCACSQRDLPCSEWHSLHFPKCIISCPLFHHPFETLCVPAPDQQGVQGACVTAAHLNYLLLTHLKNNSQFWWT